MSKFLDEIEACIPALRRYARALCGDAEQADDLVQDTLERAIRKQRLWAPTGALQAWVFTILTNIYRNDLRSQKRRPHLTPIEDLSVPPATPPEQHGQLELSETVRALEHLPVEQKQVLLLVAVEGFAYKEAAAILKIPVGTLMSRLGRARKALRQMTNEGVPQTPSKPSPTGHLRSVK